MSEPMKAWQDEYQRVSVVTESDALRYAAEEREDERQSAGRCIADILIAITPALNVVDSARINRALAAYMPLPTDSVPPAQGEQEGKETP